MHGHFLKGYLRDGKEIEGSGGEGQLVVHLDENFIADKTFGEIEAALQSGRGAVVEMYGNFGWFCSCGDSGSGSYSATFFGVTVPPGGLDPQLSGMRSSNSNATAADYPDFRNGQS